MRSAWLSKYASTSSFSGAVKPMSSSITHTCSGTELLSDGSADFSVTVRHHRQSASAWKPHAMLLGLVPFRPAHLRQVPAALAARVRASVPVAGQLSPDQPASPTIVCRSRSRCGNSRSISSSSYMWIATGRGDSASETRSTVSRPCDTSRLTCIRMPAAVSAVAHSRMRRSWPGKGLCERTSTALRGLLCSEEQAGMPRLNPQVAGPCGDARAKPKFGGMGNKWRKSVNLARLEAVLAGRPRRRRC